MNGLGLLSAVAFDPAIRGVMVVVVSTLVWGGSLYTILMTNTGVRVGFLISMSATFGWCFLMGIIWTIYGIGLIGRAPAWMITDVNFDRADPMVAVPQTEQLPAHADLPDAAEIMAQYPLVTALAHGAEGEGWEPATITELKTIVQPWATISTAEVMNLSRDAIEKAPDAVAADSATEALINGGGTALRDAVRADANSVREAVDAPLGDWCLLTESDPRRGEAQASADAALANADAFPGADGETDTTDYLIKNVFLYGGKEPCEPITESSMVKRTWHRVATVFQVKNPDMYAAATAVRSVQHVVPPGGTPPPAESLDDTSEVTVVMLRNLGNKRMIPFVFAVVTFLGFVIFTTMLHYRDKEAMAVRAAFSGAGAGK